MLNQIKKILPRSFKRVVKDSLRNIWESNAYYFFKGPLGKEKVRHIVFVCKGNVCRSTFAEHYMKSLLADFIITTESCGIEVDQGGFSPPEAVHVGKEFGIDLSTFRSKGLLACDLQNADLIIPMEFKQYLKLKAMLPGEQKRKIRLLREFAPWPVCFLCNIFDPYGLDAKDFRRCFRIMQRALDGLKRHIDMTMP